MLDQISLSLNRGEALLLTGPNGAGKSTLLRVLAGLCPVQAGSFSFNGLRGGTPEQALDIAYLGHLDALKPGLTLRENLALEAGIGGGQCDEALEALDLLTLADLPRGFSPQDRNGAVPSRAYCCARPRSGCSTNPAWGSMTRPSQHSAP